MEVVTGGRSQPPGGPTDPGAPTGPPKLPDGSVRKVLIGVVVVLALAIGWSSFYTVEEQEQAAILTFGAYTETREQAGLHFKLPYPIQQVVIVKANLVQQLQIGYRESGGQIIAVEEEALMITGDENLVSADAVVEWKVADLQSYLYNISDPELFLRNAASAAIRSVIGSTNLDYAITEGKTVIQGEVKSLLDEKMLHYNTGIQIVDLKFQDIEPPEGTVQQAFREVTNAREEKNTKINQAQKYVNDILPKARGEAQALLEQAEAEKHSRVVNAQGDVAKFNALYNEYVSSPGVTEDRLILETLERILPNARLIITDGSGDTVSYLPLNELMRSSTTGSQGSAAGATRTQGATSTPAPAPAPAPVPQADAPAASQGGNTP